MESVNVASKTTVDNLSLKTLFAAEVFSKLSLSEQDEIISLIKSLLLH